MTVVRVLHVARTDLGHHADRIHERSGVSVEPTEQQVDNLLSSR